LRFAVVDERFAGMKEAARNPAFSEKPGFFLAETVLIVAERVSERPRRHFHRLHEYSGQPRREKPFSWAQAGSWLSDPIGTSYD